MALLYDPGRFMPAHQIDFLGASWLMAWPHGLWCMHDARPGGNVYLVDVGHQRIVWHTRVTESFAVPYEAVADLAGEVERRWGLDIDIGTLPVAGYCVGWRAEPIARLDRELEPDPLDAAGEDLRLDGFQFTDELSPRFVRRWNLQADEPHWCTGIAHLGWFGT